MPSDIRLSVPNRPGSGQKLLQALADADINIDGVCADIRSGESWAYVHLLVEDGDEAKRVIEAAGIEVQQIHTVDLVEIEDEPGTMLSALRRYTEAGRNVEVFYMAYGGRLVVGTEDMRREIRGVRMRDARY